MQTAHFEVEDRATPREADRAAPRQGSSYLPFLNSLRGFVIAQIVLLHAFALAFRNYRQFVPDDDMVKIVNVFLQAAFHDSTIYFTMISGILFSRVFSKRTAVDYLKSRFTNVIVPFLVFSAILTLYGVGFPNNVTFPEDVTAYLSQLGENIALGSARFHFWYIPVLFILFLISPLLYRLLILQRHNWLGIILILVPLIVPRRGVDFTLQSTVYFLGAYVAGLYIGADPLRIVSQLKARWPYIAAIATVTTGALMVLYWLKIGRFGFFNIRESLYYIQKIALFGLFMLAFHRFEDRLARISFLNTLAAFAFGIYILHVPILELAVLASNQLTEMDHVTDALLLAIACFAISLLASVLLIMGLKQLLGSRSKFAIGC